MRVKFLGTGTSTGVPEIGCKCEVCTSNDIKDRRLRASVLILEKNKRILIDCGPDFREQIINEEFAPIDGVLITHEHYDHISGLDDLRPFCKFDDINIYANNNTVEALKRRIPYCFATVKYPGVPNLLLNKVSSSNNFDVSGIKVIPIQVMHNKLPILGFRINNFAYLTDVKEIPESEYGKLEGLNTLVISALRHEEHLSHQTLDQALDKITRIAPKKTYLIHMSHHMGLHEVTQHVLPEDIYFAYDGLEITV